jgi:hypothetical protein
MTLTLPPQLWDDPAGPRVRRSDPLTSHLAADSNHDRALVEAAVLRLFEDVSFGYTDFELTKAYFLSSACPPTHTDSPRKRRSDLAGRGLLKDSGEKRKSPSGRMSTVWVLA